MASLRRIGIGPFEVADAIVPPEDRAELRDAVRRRLVPLDAIPLSLPSLRLQAGTQAVAFRAGRAVITIEAEPPDARLVAVRDADGRLLGVGTASGVELRPRVVLSEK